MAIDPTDLGPAAPGAPDLLRIHVADFIVIQRANGNMSFERCGKPWYAANALYRHSKLVLALARKIRELQE